MDYRLCVSRGENVHVSEDDAPRAEVAELGLVMAFNDWKVERM